ncbi:hypothetical protein JOQ06_018481, partial [Pogonophryne albipinna]
ASKPQCQASLLTPTLRGAALVFRLYITELHLNREVFCHSAITCADIPDNCAVQSDGLNSPVLLRLQEVSLRGGGAPSDQGSRRKKAQRLRFCSPHFLLPAERMVCQ